MDARLLHDVSINVTKTSSRDGIILSILFKVISASSSNFLDLRDGLFHVVHCHMQKTSKNSCFHAAFIEDFHRLDQVVSFYFKDIPCHVFLLQLVWRALSNDSSPGR